MCNWSRQTSSAFRSSSGVLPQFGFAQQLLFPGCGSPPPEQRFALHAPFEFACALCSASSALLRSVMSSVTPTNPATLPSESVKIPFVMITSWSFPSGYVSRVSYIFSPGCSKARIVLLISTGKHFRKKVGGRFSYDVSPCQSDAHIECFIASKVPSILSLKKIGFGIVSINICRN